MNCPHCNEKMNQLDSYAFWCAKCGTARVQGGGRWLTPALFDLCRDIVFRLDHATTPEEQEPTMTPEEIEAAAF